MRGRGMGAHGDLEQALVAVGERSRLGVEPFGETDPVERRMEELRNEFGGRQVILGVDRLDYTKGIPERLRALDRFLADCPEYRGKVVFIQAGMPSRTSFWVS